MPSPVPILAKLNRRLSVISKNLTPITDDNTKVVIRELQRIVFELQKAVNELQELRITSKTIELDGFPNHGAACELLDGQFLRLTQTAAAPTLLTVEHGLKRIPQGALWIAATGVNQILLAGSVGANIAPANSTTVSFQLNGSTNDTHICILF